MRSSRFSATLAAAFLTMCTSSAQDAKPSRETDSLCRAAIAGYSANVARFPHFDCLFRLRKGKASSAADAIEGKVQNSESQDHRSLVDDGFELFSALAPSDLPAPTPAGHVAGKSGGRVGSSSSHSQFLSDGKRQASFNGPMLSANLFRTERSTYDGITPVWQAVGHRGRNGPDFLLAAADKWAFQPKGLVDVDGKPAVAVGFRSVKYDAEQIFYLDPAWGYYPRIVASLDEGKEIGRTVTTAVRDLGGRYFPERSVHVHYPRKAGQPYFGFETTVLELDAARAPDRSRFHLPVKAGTSVCEFGNPDARSFRLKQQEEVHVDDLPRLFEMLERSSHEPLMDTALPPRNTYSWVRWTIGGLGVAVAFGGLAYFVRRRRR